MQAHHRKWTNFPVCYSFCCTFQLYLASLNCRRAALEKWKQLNGVKATYSNLISVFERAGYQSYANKVKEIVKQLCSEVSGDSDIDDKPSPASHFSPPPPPELPVFPAPTQYIVLSSADLDSSDVPLQPHIDRDQIHPGNMVR